MRLEPLRSKPTFGQCDRHHHAQSRCTTPAKSVACGWECFHPKTESPTCTNCRAVTSQTIEDVPAAFVAGPLPYWLLAAMPLCLLPAPFRCQGLGLSPDTTLDAEISLLKHTEALYQPRSRKGFRHLTEPCHHNPILMSSESGVSSLEALPPFSFIAFA